MIEDKIHQAHDHGFGLSTAQQAQLSFQKTTQKEFLEQVHGRDEQKWQQFQIEIAQKKISAADKVLEKREKERLHKKNWRKKNKKVLEAHEDEEAVSFL